jgi:hypothetical protein
MNTYAFICGMMFAGYGLLLAQSNEKWLSILMYVGAVASIIAGFFGWGIV